MRKIRTVKELKSPARDLPADLVLTVGEHISEAVADDLVHRGYADEHDESSPSAGEGDPLDKLKKPDLVTLATEMGVEVTGDMTKPQLIEAIEAKRKEG